jgi:hypothetical protein
MTVIVWILASSYFVWTLSQNTVYNDAVRERNQLESDILSENVKVTNTTYSVNAVDNINVSAIISNIGSSGVQFLTLWVHASNSTPTSYSGCNFTKLSNVNIQGGASLYLNAIVAIAGLSPNSTYSLAAWLITGRGNVVPLQESTSSNIIVSQTTQGIGALMMDFENFTYYTVKGGNQLDPFPSGSSGYAVSSGGGNIAFRLILTNLDQQKRSITLISNSVFFSIFPTSPQQVRGSYWYIVNVNGAGVISSSYTPVILPYNVPVAVYFASDHAIVPGQPFIGSSPRFTGTAPVNLALIGQLGSSSFGQNIPFVSILVLS